MQTQFIRSIMLVFITLTAVNAHARQPIFFSLYGGGTSFDADYQFALPIDLDLDDDGNTFGLGVGYEVTDNWIVQLDYTYTDADQVTIGQFLLSLNYKYPLPFFKGMYGVAGVIVGEGKLEWDDSPDVANKVFDDLDADQSALGLQLGLEYDLTSSWSTSLKYQYLDQEFKTHLQTADNAQPEVGGRANFYHENFHYVLFGISYHY
jgi:opacity protein-like surface antigen